MCKNKSQGQLQISKRLMQMHMIAKIEMKQ